VFHLSRRVAFLAAIVLAVGAVSVRTFAGASACSIDGVATKSGLIVDRFDAPVSVQVPTVSANALKEFPGSTVVEERLAKISSVVVPVVDGRTAWVLRLANVPDTPSGGPIGAQVGNLQTLCTVTMYDADTGEFLITIRNLAAH
jgi:hypothetical protein